MVSGSYDFPNNRVETFLLLAVEYYAEYLKLVFFSSIQVEFTVRSGGSDKIETTYPPTKETDLCDGSSHEIQGKLTS